jgi:hypothetical protein
VRRSREEGCRGERGSLAARSASSARLMPDGPLVAQRSEIAGKLRPNCRQPRGRSTLHVAKKQRFGPPIVARCQQGPGCCLSRRNSAAGSLLSCEVRQRSSQRRLLSGRVFLSRSTAPRGEVDLRANGNCFRKRADQFQQKIIWVLHNSRVQFDSGMNRRSQATRSRKTTRVSQPTTTATGD